MAMLMGMLMAMGTVTRTEGTIVGRLSWAG